ncbi:MAG TPA: N-acetyltransferase [Tenuifilaceae bacterium]|jgi:putative acetyltransferase|nr:N-acetyltransferase [Tenuifilaceae bacterium]HPX05597.1 N-acetyltransferase [Tenuifilaceae bacterium]HQB78520.1 N-acetyltransferase [Tenuifilaceae bacterium]
MEISIRPLQEADLDTVVDLWLKSSIKAHSFIEASFWEGQVNAMREVYIPSADTWVADYEGMLVGFVSLNEEMLAALFVHPFFQGNGIGKQLLQFAMEQSDSLVLSVYKENKRAMDFYRKQGFEAIQEQVDKHTGMPEVIMVWENE